MKVRYSLVLFAFLFSFIALVSPVFACTSNSECTGSFCGSNGLTYGYKCCLGSDCGEVYGQCVLDLNNQRCENYCCDSECRNDGYSSGYCSGTSCNCGVAPSPYYPPTSCSVSATVSTPSDTYVGHTVYSTITLSNSGGSGGYVDVTAYLCRDDPSCWSMNCGNGADPRVWVPARSTSTLTCSATAPQEGYYRIKAKYSGCDADPTVYSGTFRIWSTYVTYPTVGTCQISLYDKSIPSSIRAGDTLNIYVKLSMSFQYGYDDPYATTTVYVERAADPHSQSKTFYFSYSGDTDGKTFSFSTSGWSTGTYNVYVKSKEQSSYCSLSKTYLGTVYVNPSYYYTYPEYCTERYLGSYSCSGSYRQQLYQYSDCRTEWKKEYCSYGCSNGYCLSAPGVGYQACTAKYLDTYRCIDNQRQQLYQYSDCRTEWRNSGYCITDPADPDPIVTYAPVYVSPVYVAPADGIREMEVARVPFKEEMGKVQVSSETIVTTSYGNVILTVILSLFLLLGISAYFVLSRKPKIGRNEPEDLKI